MRIKHHARLQRGHRPRNGNCNMGGQAVIMADSPVAIGTATE